MDRNSIIGILIIFALLMTWSYLNQPTEEQLAEEQRRRDSLAQLEVQTIEEPETAVINPTTDSSGQEISPSGKAAPSNDSLVNRKLQEQFGPFAASAQGEDQTFTLENDFLLLEFSSRGGRIKKAVLKKYDKILLDEEKKETKVPVQLLEDEKNKFEYLIPVPAVSGGLLSTRDLYFNAQQEGNAIILRAQAGPGQYIEQTYTLVEGYKLDYDLRLVGLDKLIDRNAETIALNWVNYLDKLEINTQYERMYSTVYFKPAENGVDYCSCRSDDEENLEKPVKWVSHTHQFFNSSLIADESFASAELEVKMMEEEDDDLKKTVSRIEIPIARLADEKIGMHMYVGPNEFKRLAAYDLDLEDVIPFGWSIFGTINRWIIRPIFSFLSSFIGSAGIVILVLTFIVKAALYPLTYKMLYSQSKMGALKPEISKVRDRFKDDQQKQQMETMKLYREFGANPLGGCFPIALQMPIWFALYRFFPASIEFRQAGFLWASDLSSYDVFAWLPFEIPFYGSHVSMFTLLWAGTTVIYTFYNSRHMDMSMNPTMKYMQYFMPVMFLFFFNNFAAGLTCYLLFSNILNITQTLVTKNLIIDQDKIKREMEAYRKKPKKKKGFQERLEKALKEQQRIAEEKQKKNKK